MAEVTVPDDAAYCLGAAGYPGTEAFCGISSRAYGGRHSEWDGDKGLFAGALFCASVGGKYNPGEPDTTGCGCPAI